MEYSKVSNKEWEEIILKFDNAHFFHSPIWAKILEKTYKHRPATRLYEIEGKEILVPMMERNMYGFKSFDFINDNSLAGGLFSESDITTDDFNAIANDIIGGRNLSFSLALPPFVNLSKGRSSSKIKEDWKVKDEPNIVHILNLEGKNFEYIWKNIYKKSTRKSIRRATKKGVEVRNADSSDDFKAFFNIYSIWVRKWGKAGIAVELLNNLYKYASSHIRLSLATKDDKIIAGQFSFLYSKTLNFYMGAFLPEYGTFNPNRMLHNESIEYACQEGYKYLNMGPSRNIDYIGNFKEEFGAEKVEINKYRVHSNLAKILNKINNLRSYLNDRKNYE